MLPERLSDCRGSKSLQTDNAEDSFCWFFPSKVTWHEKFDLLVSRWLLTAALKSSDICFSVFV